MEETSKKYTNYVWTERGKLGNGEHLSLEAYKYEENISMS